jgi:predicted DNA-binding transcriptional regulator AlpA
MHPYVHRLFSTASRAPTRDDVPAGAGPELLTASETARRLRLAKQTLARWRCEGRGPPFIRMGVGGRVAYLTVDVDAWLASRRAFSTAEADRAV